MQSPTTATHDLPNDVATLLDGLRYAIGKLLTDIQSACHAIGLHLVKLEAVGKPDEIVTAHNMVKAAHMRLDMLRMIGNGTLIPEALNPAYGALHAGFANLAPADQRRLLSEPFPVVTEPKVDGGHVMLRYGKLTPTQKRQCFDPEGNLRPPAQQRPFVNPPTLAQQKGPATHDSRVRVTTDDSTGRRELILHGRFEPAELLAIAKTYAP